MENLNQEIINETQVKSAKKYNLINLRDLASKIKDRNSITEFFQSLGIFDSKIKESIIQNIAVSTLTSHFKYLKVKKKYNCFKN